MSRKNSIERDGETYKRCPDCGAEKLLKDFHKRCCKGAAGFQTYCKECCKRRDEIRKTPERTRRDHLKCHMGIDESDFKRLSDIQAGRCALCFRIPHTVNRKLVIDHDHGHSHGRKSQVACKDCIRGLLCDHCNMTLGLLEDCPHLQNDLARLYLTKRPFKII